MQGAAGSHNRRSLGRAARNAVLPPAEEREHRSGPLATAENHNRLLPAAEARDNRPGLAPVRGSLRSPQEAVPRLRAHRPSHDRTSNTASQCP